MRTKTISGVLILVLSAGLGCQSMRQAFKPAGQRRQLVVASNLIMPDLPVPQGFKIDHPRSYFVNPNKGTRVVFVTYRGRGAALELMEFFRQNMSISGWTLEEESGDFGSYVLFFKNAKEDLEIKIKPGRMSTEIVLSVKPTGGKS